MSDFKISGKNYLPLMTASAAQGLSSARQAAPEETTKVNNSSEVDSPRDVKDAAQKFEALLLHQMFQAMWNTIPEGGILSGSKEESYFRDMFTEGLSETISKGQGIGIKQVIAREMYRSEGLKSQGKGDSGQGEPEK